MSRAEICRNLCNIWFQVWRCQPNLRVDGFIHWNSYIFLISLSVNLRQMRPQNQETDASSGKISWDFQSDSLALPFIKGQGWRYIHQGKSGLHFKKYLGIPQQKTTLLLMTMNIKTDINTKKSPNLNIKLAMASL